MQQRLIDPTQIPGLNVGPLAVGLAADEIDTKAKAISGGGTAVVAAWSALPAVYSADGAEMLYATMGPVESASERLSSALIKVASAFREYSETVVPLREQAYDLCFKAWDLVHTVNAFTPHMGNPENFWVGFGFGQTWIEHWYEDPTLNRTNNDLIGQAYLLGEKLREAADRCAADIRAAGGLWSGTVVAASLEIPDQLDLPWGATGDRQESCAEKAATFVPDQVGGVLGGAGDMVSGLGALLLGYDFRSWPPPGIQMIGGLFSGERENGFWLPGTAQQLETYAAAWTGLGKLATGLVFNVQGPLISEVLLPQLRDLGVDAGFVDGAQDWFRDSTTSATNLVTGFVGYEFPDEWWDAETWVDYNGFQGWIDNPGDQAGRVGFNLATLLIPVKGGGALAHGLDAAGDAARLSVDDAAAAAFRGGTRLIDDVASVVRQGDDLGRVVDDIGGLSGRTADDLAGLQGARPLDDLGRTADDLPPSPHGTPDAPPPHGTPDAPAPRDPAGDPPSGHPDGEVPPRDGEAPRDGETPRDGEPPRDPDSGPNQEPSPFEADKAARDVDVPPSSAFDEALVSRDAAVAARLEAAGVRDELVAALRDRGVDVPPQALTTSGLERILPDIQRRFDADPQIAGLLDRLEDAAKAERQTLRDLLNASERLGTEAARDLLTAEHVRILIDDVPGSGRFDLVGLSDDGLTLIVVEAKGGTASLGAGRLLPDGTRVAQGSTAYFVEIFRRDPEIAELLRTRPDIAQGLADGTIGFRYDLVQARPNGSVSVSDLRLNDQYLQALRDELKGDR